jgi:hypothetical protein
MEKSSKKRLKTATVKDLKRRAIIPAPKFGAKIRVGCQKRTRK